MKERKIIANLVMCPDGTIIQSFNRHDYKTHTSIDTWKHRSKKMDDRELVPDKTRETMVDGGTDYLRRGGTYTEMSIYEDDHFEVIRRFLCRGGRGLDGKSPLTWVPIFRMSDSWLKATIEYTPDNYFNKFYQMELDYRAENGIKIDE